MRKGLWFLSLFSLLCAGLTATAQPLSLRCTNNAARSWWDVQGYELDLVFDTASTQISGSCRITARITGKDRDSLQLDLEEPLRIDSVTLNGRRLGCSPDAGAWFVKGPFADMALHDSFSLLVAYHGAVRQARQAPWDGGMVRSRDSAGNNWLAIACQSEGAGIWFPCKNFQGDEPDAGVRMSYTVPAGLTAIGNGRLLGRKPVAAGQETWTWSVSASINNYDITFYIGNYVHLADSIRGSKGLLTLDYYVLPGHREQALRQFAVVKPMLLCFEDKIGPYPFYEDGYKLVEAPYLGMEHQSAVAYGNGYRMGYHGLDRTGTGAGLDFDFIIIHESGHEWFGNSITAYDKADTWIQEGFTTYTETIFEECLKGKERALLYQQGKVRNIRNDRPVQGAADQCDEGSGDHYDKAAFMIHMIRQVMDNDSLFFAMLRDMSRTYYHRLVTGWETEQFINNYSGRDFSKVFEQYLRRKDLPVLEIRRKSGVVRYRWGRCVPGFDMPVRIYAGKMARWLNPTPGWQEMKLPGKIRKDASFLLDLDLR